MATPKSKSSLMIGAGKMPKAKLGTSTSGAKSPLLKGVKQHKGKGSQITDFSGAVPSFGMTGMTGES
jgi:hypothetical protein